MMFRDCVRIASEACVLQNIRIYVSATESRATYYLPLVVFSCLGNLPDSVTHNNDWKSLD